MSVHGLSDKQGEISDAAEKYFYEQYGEHPDKPLLINVIVEYLVSRVEKLEEAQK